MNPKTHIAQVQPFRWQDVPLLAYKEDDGSHFKCVTRQVLFDEGGSSGVQMRYFEVAPGGHSTLEKHDHVHSVVVIRGRGEALVGSEIHSLSTHDLVRVPPQTWHQFRATAGEPLGFLCLVKNDRDKPQRPTPAELASMRADSRVASFLRI